MNRILIVFATALWLGILTSISPCPLATNITAISYLAKRIAHLKAVLLSGIAYTLGRMFAYAILGFLIIYSLLSVPVVAQFLQKYMNIVLGPVLLLAGLFVLDILKIRIPGIAMSREKHETLAKGGLKGAFLLGFIFALSFCPLSAALFFGSLIPLALNERLGVTLPFIYGIGTGLPVLFFACLISFGARSISKWFHVLGKIERYARMVTGVIFILAGLFYIISYILLVRG